MSSGRVRSPPLLSARHYGLNVMQATRPPLPLPAPHPAQYLVVSASQGEDPTGAWSHWVIDPNTPSPPPPSGSLPDFVSALRGGACAAGSQP